MQTQEAFNFEPPLPENERNLRLKAEKWIAEHPRIYAAIERLALEKARTGRKFGIGHLVEVLRWEMEKLESSEDYYINNSYRSYVARKLVADHPQLEGLIEMRKVRY